MRRFAACLAFALLAACSAGGGDIVSSPVGAAFSLAEGRVGEIEVTVADRQPVETAALVAPDGEATPAHQIDRSKTVEDEGGFMPSFGVGVFGGSSGHVGTSVGINIPVGRSGAPHDPVIDSRARIRVPDMAAYRAGWQDWKIRIELGTGAADRRVMEIPAPRPPEG
ncbi:MAG: hypothetical protein BroJett029_17770 [Alphaproteobacteria bacterium]|nr:MAG: hypothetical protein BroJett029_17770 [Alphaproteobacteria bacterium]